MKKIRKGCSDELTRVEKYINLAIKEQFYLQQENTIRLSLNVIYNLIKIFHYRADVLDILEYLNKRWSLTCEAINFRYRMSYLQDTYIIDRDRCYVLQVEDFLTVQELHDFHQMMRGSNDISIEEK